MGTNDFIFSNGCGDTVSKNERLQNILDRAPIGISLINRDGDWLEVNDYLVNLVEYSREEMLTMSPFQITHPDDTPQDKESFQLLKDGTITEITLEKRYISKNQKIIWVSLNVSKLDDKTFIVISKDITDFKQNEKKLARNRRSLSVFAKVNEVLVRAGDEKTLLTNVCETIVEDGLYGLAWIGYMDHNEDKKVLPIIAAGQAKNYPFEIDISWDEKHHLGNGPTGKAIRSAKPFINTDFHSSENFGPWKEIANQYGFHSSATFPLITSKGNVFGALNVYATNNDAFSNGEIILLEKMAGDLSFGIETLQNREKQEELEETLLEANQKLEVLSHEIVRTMGKVFEAHDPYTQGHEEGVAQLAKSIGIEMGLDEEEIKWIEVAGLLHDIGKIAIPAEILAKPRVLTSAEKTLVHQHSIEGYNILKDINFNWPVADVVLQHHERMDGSGYPMGLKGDEILLPARILCVADVVDAMASHRPYRPSLGAAAAVEEFKNNPEKYDSRVLEAYFNIYKRENGE